MTSLVCKSITFSKLPAIHSADLRKLANEENLPRKQRKVLLQLRGADNLAEQFQVEVARKTLMLARGQRVKSGKWTRSGL